MFDWVNCSRRARSLAVLFAVTAGSASLFALSLPGPAAAASTTVAFTTQGCTTWTVPNAVSSVQIQATGAAGNAGIPAGGRGPGGAGGLGDGCRGPCRG
jgi:hypothetical protein